MSFGSTPEPDSNAEWLETDGLGGFASGTVSGVRSRRYHALLLTATHPPTGRFVLVNGFEAHVETSQGTFALSSHRYTPGVMHPDGAGRIERFVVDPWPTWTFAFEDGTKIEQEILVRRGGSTVALSWRLGLGARTPDRNPSANGRVVLVLRPLLSGRDYHSLHHENAEFHFEPELQDRGLVFRPYAGVPPIAVSSNGEYTHDPHWYRNFLYEEERARGLDFLEDLAAPGVLRFDLRAREAVCLFSASDTCHANAESVVADLKIARRKRSSRNPLHRSAEAYVVRRGRGKTIVAGYPWFSDWGRDTFISIRGLCFALGRFDEAEAILGEWAGAVSEGMLPNRFPDQGEEPEYNSVDASLWYVIAIGELLQGLHGVRPCDGRMEATPSRPQSSDVTCRMFVTAVDSILCGYARGTRFGIGLDPSDGLLRAGVRGVQLTWMDAKVGDSVVTPRIGKPIEIEALWVNVLKIGASLPTEGRAEWARLFTQAKAAFEARFWNESRGCLYDVIDVDHRSGETDASLRPNQIFAVGGLPETLLSPARARAVVDVVETSLHTPLGLRSLAPGEPGYVGRYQGGVYERDGAYHQGTVWPWLVGPFAEAWVRVRGETVQAKREALKRFVTPLFERHIQGAGLGHISEIADGDPPHTPRGCPFQAWSLGELIRLTEIVLRTEDPQ